MSKSLLKSSTRGKFQFETALSKHCRCGLVRTHFLQHTQDVMETVMQSLLN